MGSAIPLMHYTGMWAVRFRASDTPFSTEWTGEDVLSGNRRHQRDQLSGHDSGDHRRRSSTDGCPCRRPLPVRARGGEAHFRLLAEAIPQIVWTAVPGGGIDYCSERWTQITGVPTRDALGFGWQNSLHPDDIPTASATGKRPGERE